ncbi:methionyl-tRNA formyltransferase [Atopobium fossor]|uniref:methionyl-tRNA formyltransferase n=1 Tax=Atopobium fossor TaxID=39487 RepID=UPI000425FE0A|nr:methionyl-tRNA formyltransferase [Atopobium fossor]
MRIVFMGTPNFAVPSLEAVATAHEVALVVTRPDAIRKRGKKLEPSAVKTRAYELDLPVLETARMTPEALAAIQQVRPDIIVVAAYGCILPDELLAIPAIDCINVHASSLPRWRGAAPIQRAILAGDRRAGVSIMRVVHELDAGAYCAQADLEIGTSNTTELTERLAVLGAQTLIHALDAIADGNAVWQDQDEDQVTYASKVSKTEMLLSPKLSAVQNALLVQASSDTAPARVVIAQKGVRVLEAFVVDADNTATMVAGEVIVKHGHVYLTCTDALLELVVVRPDGKRDMPAQAWSAGLRGEGLTWEKL